MTSFEKKALLAFHHEWRATLMATPRAPPAAPPAPPALPCAHTVSQLCSSVPEPQMAPAGASALSVSAAAVQVSWLPIPWNRHTGRVLGYEVSPGLPGEGLGNQVRGWDTR